MKRGRRSGVSERAGGAKQLSRRKEEHTHSYTLSYTTPLICFLANMSSRAAHVSGILSASLRVYAPCKSILGQPDRNPEIKPTGSD
jgi:hypothetical protein